MESETLEILPTTRSCFVPRVPTCTNNSSKDRNMVFVPIKNNLKHDWCQLAGRNCPKRRLYCCEMHLDLEKDLENYDKWRQGGVYPIMSKNATLRGLHVLSKSSEIPNDSLMVTLPNEDKQDKIIQVKPSTSDKGTNKTCKEITTRKRKLQVLHEYSSTTPVVSGSSYEIKVSSSSSPKSKIKQCFPGREFLLQLIEKNPLMYIGIRKNCLSILDVIVEENQEKTCKLHLILTLFKIRQGDTLSRISQQFQISNSRLKKVFYETTYVLSSYFDNFITSPDPLSIKSNLPYAFKIKYSNVHMIIDCFEIGIEKPSDPVRQAQTWSAYKSCNTMKYLVGATPNGLITFISKGFGGRITDKAITIESGFIDCLPTNCVIMADRGFKEIESLLCVKNIKLLRPPSVYSHLKPSKEQVRESKVIASLRIHIERVIRRLREFRILKPHSVINHKHVAYLDEYVIIACGLCNLQSSIIKEK